MERPPEYALSVRSSEPACLACGDNTVVHGEAFETSLLGLDADEADGAVCGRSDAAFAPGVDAEAVTRLQGQFFAVNIECALAFQHNVDFFILLVRMDKGHGNARRHEVDGDFRAAEIECVVQLGAAAGEIDRSEFVLGHGNTPLRLRLPVFKQSKTCCAGASRRAAVKWGSVLDASGQKLFQAFCLVFGEP